MEIQDGTPHETPEAADQRMLIDLARELSARTGLSFALVTFKQKVRQNGTAYLQLMPPMVACPLGVENKVRKMAADALLRVGTPSVSIPVSKRRM